MKRIAHLVIGVAVAACIPGAIEAAQSGNPLYMLLGAGCGLLPDVLDDWLVRFRLRPEITVTPDPLSPDPAIIADAVAVAFNTAATERRTVTIALNTMALGSDAWQSYGITFDTLQRRVLVSLGVVVDGRGGVRATREAPPHDTASASLACGVALVGEAEIRMGGGEGLTIGMTPASADRVSPVCRPWSHQTTHSLVAAALTGLVACLVWDGTAGVTSLVVYLSHILLDQIGQEGCSLFAPFSRRRYPGARWVDLEWPTTGFALNWSACALILWILYARHADDVLPDIHPFQYAFYAVLLPLAAFAALCRRA